ncbi:MAR-binding filament-like protein 1-1 isoform 2 [Melia azedarach]|uniref:MAR-binding filament-like protein 1-1 isoform 2 n=1 Tax=Melia azedarach TaxID=155640 RepID=A0ACC1XQE0_MELAZ|nr:MAR-binding filament-like protein 1-1 isoform 2 [Melia azedarach]
MKINTWNAQCITSSNWFRTSDYIPSLTANHPRYCSLIQPRAGMASLQSCSIFCKTVTNSFDGVSALPLLLHRKGRVISKCLNGKETVLFQGLNKVMSNRARFIIPRSSGSSNSSGSKDESSDQTKTPFGYTRKDVLLIGVGVTAIGYGLKSGLELVGIDPLQAGNIVEVIIVLGLMLGWVSTYIFRVSNKEMTYAQQLRDYESKVMEKRLEGLTEAELEALLEQVEEEKRRLASGEQVN